MAWARIDDQLHKHSKFASVSLEAIGLWTLCMSHCNDELTDGFVAESTVVLFAGQRAPAMIEELCRVAPRQRNPLWHRVEGGFQVHDYLEYNQSREQILAGRKAAKLSRSEAGRLGGIKSGQTRSITKQTKQNDLLEATRSNAKQNEPPSRTRPVPVPIPMPAAAADRVRGQIGVAEFKPSAAAADFAKKNCPTVNTDAERLKFVAHFSGTSRSTGWFEKEWLSWLQRAVKEYPAAKGPDRNKRHFEMKGDTEIIYPQEGPPQPYVNPLVDRMTLRTPPVMKRPAMEETL